MILPLVVALASVSLSADPNEPVSTIGVRGNLRATVATTLPFTGDPEAPFQLRMPVLFELYNDDIVTFVPYEFWRARFAIEAAWRRSDEVLGRPGRLELVAAFEHESDHPTALGWGPTGWINFNDFALRARTTTTVDTLGVELGGTVRLHVLTCTIGPDECGSYGGLGGSRTIELALDAGVQGPLPVETMTWFASGSAGWTHGRLLALEERRIIANVGLVIPHAGGHLLPFLVAFAGSQLGFSRWKDVAEIGVGLRWAPGGASGTAAR